MKLLVLMSFVLLSHMASAVTIRGTDSSGRNCQVDFELDQDRLMVLSINGAFSSHHQVINVKGHKIREELPKNIPQGYGVITNQEAYSTVLPNLASYYKVTVKKSKKNLKYTVKQLVIASNTVNYREIITRSQQTITLNIQGTLEEPTSLTFVMKAANTFTTGATQLKGTAEQKFDCKL